MKSLLLALLAQSAVGVPAAEPELEQLDALTEWTRVQNENGCAMRRSFGSPDAPTVLEFRRDEPRSGRFDIAITSAAHEMADGSFTATLQPGGVAFSPSLPGREMAASGALWSVWDHDIREASKRDLPSEEWDRYYARNGPDEFRAQIRSLDIEGLFDRDFSLPIGPIDTVREELGDCYDDVMVAHGLSRHDAVDDNRPVRFRNREQILRSMLNLIPQALLQRIRQDRQVLINFVIFLDANAEPTTCRLTTVPRYRELEEKGCEKLTGEGEFEFAKGEERRPAMLQAGFFYREGVGLTTTGG